MSQIIDNNHNMPIESLFKSTFWNIGDLSAILELNEYVEPLFFLAGKSMLTGWTYAYLSVGLMYIIVILLQINYWLDMASNENSSPSIHGDPTRTEEMKDAPALGRQQLPGHSAESSSGN